MPAFDLPAVASDAFAMNRGRRPRWLAVYPAPPDTEPVVLDGVTFGVIPFGPGVPHVVLHALVGSHAPDGTTTAVACVDVGDNDRLGGGFGVVLGAHGYCAFAVNVDGLCATANAEDVVVSRYPATRVPSMLGAWLGATYPKLDVPPAAGLVALIIHATTLRAFTDGNMTFDELPGAVFGDTNASVAMPGANVAKVTIGAVAAAPPTWEDIRQWAASGWVQMLNADVCSWMTDRQFAAYFLAVIGTPESAAWAIVPFNGLGSARIIVGNLCDTVGIPLTYPDYDQGINAYQQPVAGAAADLLPDADIDDLPATLFGTPLTFAQYHWLFDQLNQCVPGTAFDDTSIGALRLDMLLVNQRRSQNPGPQRRPGDIPAVRVAATQPDRDHVVGLDTLITEIAGESTGTGGHQMLVHSMMSRIGMIGLSTPYFIDAQLATDLAGSQLPDSDLDEWLRLPHQAMFICFDHDLDLDLVVTSNLDPLAGNESLLFPALYDATAGGWGTTLGELSRHGGGVTGVCVFARPDGTLLDAILWVLHLNPDPRSSISDGYEHKLVWGSISHSTVGYAVRNWAAYLAWGKAMSPPRRLNLPPEDDTRAWRKLLRTSAFRKAAAAGAAVPNLRIITLTPPDQPAADIADDGPSRTVTPHLRRGHWRRSRIATRDTAGNIIGDVHGTHGVDWTYRGHWQHPVAVKGGGTGEPMTRTIYRMPTPASPPVP